MIESMGESRWLDVEARERVELDLINWFLKRKSTHLPVLSLVGLCYVTC